MIAEEFMSPEEFIAIVVEKIRYCEEEIKVSQKMVKDINESDYWEGEKKKCMMDFYKSAAKVSLTRKLMCELILKQNNDELFAQLETRVKNELNKWMELNDELHTTHCFKEISYLANCEGGKIVHADIEMIIELNKFERVPYEIMYTRPFTIRPRA